MTENEIYRLWLSKTSDSRFLRRLRWDEMKKSLILNRVKNILEFGSGVSTLLFCNLGLNVHSYETDEEYIKFVKSMCPKAKYHLWDGNSVEIPGKFDFSFVDGILPRENQLKLALKSAKIVAIDDFGGKSERRLSPFLEGWKRVDSGTTLMAVFKPL